MLSFYISAVKYNYMTIAEVPERFQIEVLGALDITVEETTN